MYGYQTENSCFLECEHTISGVDMMAASNDFDDDNGGGGGGDSG